MDIKELMQIDIDNLIETQHSGLKQYVIDKLNNVIKIIQDERYEEIEELLAYSPAGDGYGSENEYINFNYDGYARDIDEIVKELIELKRKMNE